MSWLFFTKRSSFFANVDGDSAERDSMLSSGRYGLWWNTDLYIYNEKNIFPELIPWEMDVASYEEALKNGKGITLNSGKREKLEMLNAGKLEVPASQ